jgi:hypothetical protein
MSMHAHDPLFRIDQSWADGASIERGAPASNRSACGRPVAVPRRFIATAGQGPAGGFDDFAIEMEDQANRLADTL